MMKSLPDTTITFLDLLYIVYAATPIFSIQKISAQLASHSGLQGLY